MKKKLSNNLGFTLIELLAVIVILAIIALIATPIVLNIIKDTRESAGLRSAEMYLDAVEQAVSIEKMNNTTFKPNSCTIEKGNLNCEGYDKNPIEVKVNGELPEDGIIIFEKGKISEIKLEYKTHVVVNNKENKLVKTNSISTGNYEHKLEDGTLESHDVEHGICSKCGEMVLLPGLYDENDVLLASWETLVNDYGMNIEQNNWYNIKDDFDVQQNSPCRAFYQIKSYEFQPGSFVARAYLREEFKNMSKLVIDDSVTKIGKCAFTDITDLEYVVIPDSVISIGDRAFEKSGLVEFTLGKNVTTLGAWLLGDSVNLEKVTLNDKITIIPQELICNCTKVTNIDIPNSVTKIYHGAFDNTGLTNVIIPDGVTSLSSLAFGHNSKLTSITIPDSVTSIADSAFNSCPNLKTINYNGPATGYPWNKAYWSGIF